MEAKISDLIERGALFDVSSIENNELREFGSTYGGGSLSGVARVPWFPPLASLAAD